MIIDLRTLDDGTLVEADLCVIGAGVVGITLARELMGTGREICVVESGGLDFDGDVQALYAGDNVGLPYELDVMRLRYLGGSSNHWAGQCAPLTPQDFEERSWVPYSGWPITREELQPFYVRAQPLCTLGDYLYDPDEVWRQMGVQPDAFDPNEIQYRLFQLSRPITRFGEVYREDLERAANVRLLLNANVTSIRTDEQGASVQHVELRSLEGKKARVRAGTYVLACGGIENARLLLLSNEVEPTGLGNRNDLVGRFFMEHPHNTIGVLTSDRPAHLKELYGRRQFAGHTFEPRLGIAPAMQAQEQVLDGAAILRHQIKEAGPGIQAVRQLWTALREGRVPEDLTEQVWAVARDLDGVAEFTYRKLGPDRWPLYALSESTPQPDSRVSLGEDKDPLGQRRVRLDWRLSELDKRTVAVLAHTLAAEAARLDIGRVRIEEWLLDSGTGWAPDFEPGGHHMGTTRMAVDPKKGVVDSDCRVHHVDNLYVGGSSVFPTSGSCNPTLTIVALTLRLADHLRPGLGNG